MTISTQSYREMMSWLAVNNPGDARVLVNQVVYECLKLIEREELLDDERVQYSESIRKNLEHTFPELKRGPDDDDFDMEYIGDTMGDTVASFDNTFTWDTTAIHHSMSMYHDEYSVAMELNDEYLDEDEEEDPQW